MPALPPNTTSRIFVDYITGSQSTSREHTVAVRYDALDLTQQGAQGFFWNFLQALTPASFRAGWRVLRVRNQAAGSLVSLPVGIIAGLDAFIGTAGSPSYNTRFETVEDTFQGRNSQSGRRVDISLYRAVDDSDGSFRVEAGGTGLGALVGAGVDELNAAAVQGAFISIDGISGTVWYNYMNRNYNSYWERRARLG